MINAIANIRVGEVLNHSAKFQPVNNNVVLSAAFPPQVDIENLKKITAHEPTKSKTKVS